MNFQVRFLATTANHVALAHLEAQLSLLLPKTTYRTLCVAPHFNLYTPSVPRNDGCAAAACQQLRATTDPPSTEFTTSPSMPTGCGVEPTQSYA